MSALSCALEAAGSDLDALPAAYNAARLPDVRAMQQMELMAVYCLPGTSYGNALSRTWARMVVGFATVLGLIGAKAAGAFSGKAAAAAGTGGRKASTPNPMFGAPWVKKLADPSVPPRDILRTMRLQAALGFVLLGLLAAAAAKAGALLVAGVVAPLFAEHVQPLIERHVLPLINQHVSPVVDKHVSPVLDKHVQPVLDTHVGPTLAGLKSALMGLVPASLKGAAPAPSPATV